MALRLEQILNSDVPDDYEFRHRLDSGYDSNSSYFYDSQGTTFSDIENTFNNGLYNGSDGLSLIDPEEGNSIIDDAWEPFQSWRNQVIEEPVSICFGMLYDVDVRVVGDMSVLDTKLQPIDGTTTLQRFELKNKQNHILLSFTDEGEFGYLKDNMTKGIGNLLEKKSIYFQAMAWTNTLREAIGQAQKKSDAQVSVDIYIYGPAADADEVGKRLSSAKLWLQKPEHLIEGIKYKNPHMLEFEGISADMLNPAVSKAPERNRLKKQTEDDRLRRVLKEVYNSARRQEGLTQITVTGRFKTTLLKHQKEALDFMMQRETGNIPDQFRLWRKVVVDRVESYKHIITNSSSRIRPEEKGGGVLADEMGMGKSLSILSLIVETLRKGQEWAEKRRSEQEAGPIKVQLRCTRATLIIVSSALLINNWRHEIKEHLDGSLNIVSYHGPGRPKGSTGLDTIENSDIVVTTYNTISQEFSEGNGERGGFGKASLLHSVEWYRVVLDEAHIIRRQATKFHKTCAELKANSRWCLTGTPIQNKLDDLGALFCFVRAKPFDSLRVFRRFVVAPYSQGDEDSAIKCLVHINDSLCLRRTKELLNLPTLKEDVQHLNLTEKERRQYEDTAKILYRKIRQMVGEHEKTSKFSIFQANLQLRILCNHGTYQQPFSWQTHSYRDTKEAVASVWGDSMQINCDGCSQPMPVLGTSRSRNDFMEGCPHVLCSDCVENTAAGGASQAAASNGGGALRRHCPLCVRFGDAVSDDASADDSAPPPRRYAEPSDEHYFRPDGFSTKMEALMKDVKVDLATTKSIIFSCWTRTLNLIAAHLKRENIPFSRIDGECTVSRRQAILDAFAKEDGDHVLIMTTGTGAQGLNITCANRVFIVELQWNPSVEKQAIARAIRLGQARQVSVIRYIMNNTVEQSMREQQERKKSMAQKGFDDAADTEDPSSTGDLSDTEDIVDTEMTDVV
ncbi:SNF2 family N-terminal domain-containing protein [Xylariales sp. PMI_506]|nr:SNF2 family N-terminal domain-containing protein [Xylariales sp. PMI_506]